MTQQATTPDREQQRGSLRDLVQLCSECAAAEVQIDKQHQAAIDVAAKDAQRADSEIQQRYDQQRAAVEESHAQRTSENDLRVRTKLDALKSSDQATRRRVDHDKEMADREVKEQYDHVVWLADSVMEAAQIHQRTDGRKSKELLEAQVAWLESADEQARKQIELYRQEPPEDAEAAGAVEVDMSDPKAVYAQQHDLIEQQLATLSSLGAPRQFMGFRPYWNVLIVLMLGAFGCWLATQFVQDKWTAIAIGGGATVVFLIIAGLVLSSVAQRQVRNAYLPILRAAAIARAAATRQQEIAARVAHERYAQAEKKHKLELQAAKEKFSPLAAQATKRRDTALEAAQSENAKQLALIESERDRSRREADEHHRKSVADVEKRHEEELQAAAAARERRLADIQQQHEDARAVLQHRWNEGLQRIQRPTDSREGANGQLGHDWNSPAWRGWLPPRSFPSAVRFGELRVDLKQINAQTPRQLALPDSFSVPASLAFPRHASLMIHTDHAGRAEGVRTLQMVMARLLTSLPAGSVRFTIIDPVGLGQNFAGFMHLADHDEALVGGRIWTESDHIEQRLSNLTEHMETVIQKYLRNEFATIDEYNAQAGELAEPYRFLVVADFPTAFAGDSFRRLASIASTGARCGVYTLILRDTRASLPPDARLDELEAHSLNLVRKDNHFVWKDEVFKQFPLTLDPPPSEQFLKEILDVVGKHAKESKRVEVPFSSIAPAPEKFWSLSAGEDLQVPLGRAGATRLQSLKLGRGVAQHVLIAGKTGSGKSTLLHAMISNLAMWYEPGEVEFYLVDFKKGVEFKTYAEHVLPHARAIAVESDREFGLSVLQRVDAEMNRRGEMFRKAGVQDLPAFRKQTGQKMPRTLLIIDEFQEFFSEDDRLAQDAAVLLDRLVRQGRAFGVHVLLGSQTIGGTSGLARSTIGQMAVRVALQTSEADSQLILGDNNSAARLLSRPGEAIYNDAGGLVEGNSPFQVAWLPDDQRDRYLDAVTDLAQKRGVRGAAEPVVFEGNLPAAIRKNRKLEALLTGSEKPNALAPQAWLGEPVAIKEPTAVTFRRQSGANLMIIGQQEEYAMACMAAAMLSLAAQHPKGGATFYVMSGAAADSPLAGVFEKIKASLPHETRIVEYRAVPEAVNELATQMQNRQSGSQSNPPAVYLFVYGLQRFRALRKQEESFSFSSTDEEKPPATDKQFADLLREGPALGMHVIAWSDTAVSIDRTLDRNSLREFDNRVLFQMSATDSSNLIDSPLANKLGFHRAIAYSEERGVTEKFRPYALPDDQWLRHVSDSLRK